MPDERPLPRVTLARHVALLRKTNEWTQADLARKSGTSQRTISNIENPEGPSPSLDNVELIAEAFGLRGWQLIMPTLVEDLANGNSGLSALIRAYLAADKEGRAHVLRVAEREAEYHHPRAS